MMICMTSQHEPHLVLAAVERSVGCCEHKSSTEASRQRDTERLNSSCVAVNISSLRMCALPATEQPCSTLKSASPASPEERQARQLVSVWHASICWRVAQTHANRGYETNVNMLISIMCVVQLAMRVAEH
eukprot:18790-Heterococcus_DN1.PRE.1